MKLSYEQIKAITCGATQFTVEEDGIIFHRFTQAQFDMYEKKDMGFFVKSKTSSGIKLCFRTDSRTLYLIQRSKMPAAVHIFHLMCLWMTS